MWKSEWEQGQAVSQGWIFGGEELLPSPSLLPPQWLHLGTVACYPSLLGERQVAPAPSPGLQLPPVPGAAPARSVRGVTGGARAGAWG